jgi:hypothetical protein
MTKQDKTRQKDTKQDKTRQNKTRQDREQPQSKITTRQDNHKIGQNKARVGKKMNATYKFTFTRSSFGARPSYEMLTNVE